MVVCSSGDCIKQHGRKIDWRCQILGIPKKPRAEARGSIPRFTLVLHAALLALDEQVHGTQADQDVDHPLDLWPGAQEHVDDIEVLLQEGTNADKAPVERANEDEDLRSLAKIIHREKRGKGRKGAISRECSTEGERQ